MAVKRIVKRQGQLNNALVDNQLDYPIRAEFDDIDITDLFSPVLFFISHSSILARSRSQALRSQVPHRQDGHAVGGARVVRRAGPGRLAGRSRHGEPLHLPHGGDRRLQGARPWRPQRPADDHLQGLPAKPEGAVLRPGGRRRGRGRRQRGERRGPEAREAVGVRGVRAEEGGRGGGRDGLEAVVPRRVREAPAAAGGGRAARAGDGGGDGADSPGARGEGDPSAQGARARARGAAQGEAAHDGVEQRGVGVVEQRFGGGSAGGEGGLRDVRHRRRGLLRRRSPGGARACGCPCPRCCCCCCCCSAGCRVIGGTCRRNGRAARRDGS